MKNPHGEEKYFPQVIAMLEKFSFFLIERWASSADTGKLASWFGSLGAGIDIEFLAILPVKKRTRGREDQDRAMPCTQAQAPKQAFSERQPTSGNNSVPLLLFPLPLPVTLDTHAKILTASHSKQIILKE